MYPARPRTFIACIVAGDSDECPSEGIARGDEPTSTSSVSTNQATRPARRFQRGFRPFAGTKSYMRARSAQSRARGGVQLLRRM